MSPTWPPEPVPSSSVPPPSPAPAAIAEQAPVAAPATPVPDIAPEPPRPWWRRSLSGIVVAGAFILKFGKAALLLLPKAKLLTTSGTMLVSLAAYSLIWGWKFALGFVLLLFVHEMGHVIQLRREGISASAPMFIPFMGAVVMAKSLGEDAAAEARVGLAGPLLGTLGALALLPVAAATGDDFWYALIFTGLFLNLFNLLPVVPLDGGRAMAALSPWMWFVGLFGMALLAFVYPNPIIFLILLFAVMETYKRWTARKRGGAEVTAYYRVKPAVRLAVFAVYLGLIIVCGVGMDLTHIQRSIPS
jgi:Zn-dependent protease